MDSASALPRVTGQRDQNPCPGLDRGRADWQSRLISPGTGVWVRSVRLADMGNRQGKKVRLGDRPRLREAIGRCDILGQRSGGQDPAIKFSSQMLAE